MVAQTAPAVRVAIGEEAGMAPGSISTGQMVAGGWVVFPASLHWGAALRLGSRGGGSISTRQMVAGGCIVPCCIGVCGGLGGG